MGNFFLFLPFHHHTYTSSLSLLEGVKSSFCFDWGVRVSNGNNNNFFDFCLAWSFGYRFEWISKGNLFSSKEHNVSLCRAREPPAYLHSRLKVCGMNEKCVRREAQTVLCLFGWCNQIIVVIIARTHRVWRWVLASICCKLLNIVSLCDVLAAAEQLTRASSEFTRMFATLNTAIFIPDSFSEHKKR